MTFLGFPLERAAVVAEWALIFGGIVLALLVALVSHLNGRAKTAEALATNKAIASAVSTAAVADARAAEANAKAKASEALVASANAASKEAVVKVAEAQRASAEASAKAEGFRLDIAKANERAATANETAERERLARLQLEARLADRVITDSQKSRLIAALGAIKGQTVDVTVFGDTPEVATVSGTIFGCLEKAGVLVNVFSPFGATGVRGVIVGIRPDASQAVKSSARTVVRILGETLGGGVGIEEFSKLDLPNAAGTGGQSQGAGARGQSPLRIWIGAK